MSKGKSALTGAASGAAAGAALGPWGAAGGAVIGGIAGWLGGSDDKAPTYTPDDRNFQYGLGRSDSYANQQSTAYNARQQQLAALGADAYHRTGPTQAMPDQISQVQSGGQGYLQNADAASRAQQLQALGGLQSSNSALGAFANRAQGPSAAQAQLQAGTDMAAKQQFGFARAQPGGGGAALRSAAFNAAGISGNAANAAASLRAQEDQSYRAQQLQALGAVQQGAGTLTGYSGQVRGQDQGLAQAQAGQANTDASAANQFNQGQQQLQFSVGQNNLNAGLQTTRENDATTLAAGAQSMGYDALRNQVAGANTGQGNAYESAKAAGAGLGAQNFNAATAQSNTETGMMLGALSGGAGAVAAQQGTTSTKTTNPDGSVTTSTKPNPISDVRAKTDIKPASVLAALGGKYTPEQTRQLYSQGLTERYGMPAQLNQAHDANARSQGPDRSLAEFGAAPPAADRQAQLQALGAAPLPQSATQRAEIGLGPVGVARQQQLRALMGGNHTPMFDETTKLTPDKEAAFQEWAKQNNINDVDHPDSHYDYRGYWNQYGAQPHQQGTHFTDEYKQHGHPTFSAESNYSQGPRDGGNWTYEHGRDNFHPSSGTGVDLRGAQGYEYAYKDPEADGAGRYVGPMAQDLEHLPGVVQQGQDGKKSIDAPRLTLANTAAVSEQQRRLDELERRQQLQALGGAPKPSAFARPDLVQPGGYYPAFDAAYQRGAQP